MIITASARDRLEQLLQAAPAGSIGFRMRDVIGSCRGSVPLLEPVAQAGVGDEVIMAGKCRLFIPHDLIGTNAEAVLDYDAALFGMGLNLSRDHCDNCQCNRD